jgi:hypothetical protein
MEVPSDIGYLDIEVPTAPLVLAEPPSDPERLRSCAAAITDRMSQAKSPAILVDLDADGSPEPEWLFVPARVRTPRRAGRDVGPRPWPQASAAPPRARQACT